jgi:hypothetical protein
VTNCYQNSPKIAPLDMSYQGSFTWNMCRTQSRIFVVDVSEMVDMNIDLSSGG